MKIFELINLIETDFPIFSAMSFDNSGANIVNFKESLKGILICLDVTIDCIEFAHENNLNMIISHHPIIFNEMKNINDDPVSKRIKLLNKYDINAYSCHTNFDVNIDLGMGKSLLNILFDASIHYKHDLLETFVYSNKKYGIGDILTFDNEYEFDELLKIIINNLNLDNNKISFYKFKNKIKKMIVIPGSGSSDIEKVIRINPDLLLTSDLKHNNILDLAEEGISYINATHYGLEKVFIDSFFKYLNKNINGVNILKFYNKLIL